MASCASTQSGTPFAAIRASKKSSPHSRRKTEPQTGNESTILCRTKAAQVYKVAVAYAVVGWLLIQVATQVFPFLEIPNWAIRLVIFTTALGFPVALVIAWAFELTPEGIKRTEAADAAGQRSRGGIWIAVIAIAAALSLGLFFLGRYTAGRAIPQEVSEEATASNALKSIAVLPLVNTSGDTSNEYFSDGLSRGIDCGFGKDSGPQR